MHAHAAYIHAKHTYIHNSQKRGLEPPKLYIYSMCIHAYMHAHAAYINAKHTYIHNSQEVAWSLRSYTHTYAYACMYTCVQMQRTYMQAYVHTQLAGAWPWAIEGGSKGYVHTCKHAYIHNSQERGLEPLKEGEQRIHKSRYSSIDCFISQCALASDKFNDLPLPINEKVYQKLLDEGLDHKLAVSDTVAYMYVYKYSKCIRSS
jgi:hypothetical protein